LSTPVSPRVRIETHLTAGELAAALEDDVRRGLAAEPATLPPKWFYDDRGSLLFDAITRLEAYYPYRREREILQGVAPEVAARSGADTVIELGSGTSDKSRLLLDAVAAGGRLRRIVPFDVSEGILRWSAVALAERYPGVEVRGIVGDFDHHLEALPTGGRRLVAFLGGTIGNLEPAARARFLIALAGVLAPGDALLLGTDLVKDERRLVAAYDDPEGVTAEFNRNVLHVLARELGAKVDVDGWRHVARWNAVDEWIEMWLQADGDQLVAVPSIGVERMFADGEAIRTEISAKFRPDGVRRELAAAGFGLDRWWTDAAGDFGLSLAVVP